MDEEDDLENNQFDDNGIFADEDIPFMNNLQSQMNNDKTTYWVSDEAYNVYTDEFDEELCLYHSQCLLSDWLLEVHEIHATYAPQPLQENPKNLNESTLFSKSARR
jgi:hypothetical protein